MTRPTWDEAGAPSGTGTAATTDSTADVAERGPTLERFRDEGLVARGGMGEVRRLVDQALGRSVVRKEIRPDRADRPGMLRRFLNEARITARLAHPGVVPVHDTGRLEDGRPFYTMDEIRGVTLAVAIRAVHRGGPSPAPLTPRRLLEATLRAAETVAYAHSRGIIHRDIKPDNILLGEFGSVLVVDWGLARALDDREPSAEDASLDPASDDAPRLTQAGRALGTPGYLSPEQARGEIAAVGPASDVFSLGCVLHEVVTGCPAFPGDAGERLAAIGAGRSPPDVPWVDPDLAAIWVRALRPDPAERYSAAGAFAQALADWLAGARRRERALEVLALADTHHTAHKEALAHAETARAEARALLEPLRSFDDAERKKPGWRKEDEAAAWAARAELEGSRYVSRLHGALQIEPALGEAQDRLAAWYRQRLEAAEHARDTMEAARAEELLRTYDRGAHAAYLEGTGTLRIRTIPPVRTARISRFVLRDRRLEPELVEECGPERLDGVRLPAGSYLVVLEADGHAAVRYPVLLERGGEWAEPPIWLPAPLPDGDCFVAAGPFWSGGDPGAGDGLPARRVWLEAFVIRRHPLTNAEYLAFLRDLPTDEAERWAPRGGPNPFGRVDGVYSLGDAAADAPVVCIPWHAAAAYCRWAARDGHAWRLPHSFEWEKAARGVDGRRFPWGDHFEPTWANTVDSRADPPAVTSVHAFPLDASLYGVRGLTGNSRDLCRDDYSRFGPTLAGDRLVPEEGNMEAWKVAKGGAYSNGGSLVRPATRFGASPAAVFRMVGFRLARDAFR